MSFNEDDDFADFQNCTFEQPPQQPQPSKTETNCVSDPDEDFADFSDFQNASSVVNSSGHNCDQRSNDAGKVSNESPKFESILKDAFPSAELANSVNSEDNQTIIIKEFFTDEQKRR